MQCVYYKLHSLVNSVSPTKILYLDIKPTLNFNAIVHDQNIIGWMKIKWHEINNMTINMVSV